MAATYLLVRFGQHVWDLSAAQLHGVPEALQALRQALEIDNLTALLAAAA
jgi:hypothetical protein